MRNAKAFTASSRRASASALAFRLSADQPRSSDEEVVGLRLSFGSVVGLLVSGFAVGLRQFCSGSRSVVGLLFGSACIEG